jgi:DNA-binding NarL/FixJ family response regulator
MERTRAGGTKPRVVLADDHPLIIDTVRHLLKDDCDVIAAVTDGPSLVATALALCPDIIIIDLLMPGFDGLEALRRLRARGLTTTVIVLTAVVDPSIAREALAVGAKGYVLKEAVKVDLLAAIKTVRQGLTYVTPRVRDRMADVDRDG